MIKILFAVLNSVPSLWPKSETSPCIWPIIWLVDHFLWMNDQTVVWSKFEFLQFIFINNFDFRENFWPYSLVLHGNIFFIMDLKNFVLLLFFFNIQVISEQGSHWKFDFLFTRFSVLHDGFDVLFFIELNIMIWISYKFFRVILIGGNFCYFPFFLSVLLLWNLEFFLWVIRMMAKFSSF